MTGKEHWEQLSDAAWRRMAEDWLASNRDEPPDIFNGDYIPSKVDLIVTEMKFDASTEKLWHFILLTCSLAETDWQIGQIGTDLIEHLLGWQNKWNGTDYVSQIEEQIKTNEKLARSVLFVNKYRMNDEIWTRVKSLQQRIRSA